MEFYNYNRICDDVVINTITAKVVEALGKKMEKLIEQQNSPFVHGLDGLARYLGIVLINILEINKIFIPLHSGW